MNYDKYNKLHNEVLESHPAAVAQKQANGDIIWTVDKQRAALYNKSADKLKVERALV